MKKKLTLFIAVILTVLIYSGCAIVRSNVIDLNENSYTYTATFHADADMPLFKCEVFFTDETENQTEKIKISDNTTGEKIQTVYFPENESFTKDPVYFKDITFDGRMSIIVPVERTASGIYFKAYVWNNETESFVEIPSFRNIKNPVINEAEKTILSHSSADKITSYSVYSFEKNQFVNKNSLYWEVKDLQNDENTGRIVETADNKIISEFEAKFLDYYTVDSDDEHFKPYLAEGSFWDLNSEKWKCSFKDCCK